MLLKVSKLMDLVKKELAMKELLNILSLSNYVPFRHLILRQNDSFIECFASCKGDKKRTILYATIPPLPNCIQIPDKEAQITFFPPLFSFINSSMEKSNDISFRFTYTKVDDKIKKTLKPIQPNYDLQFTNAEPFEFFFYDQGDLFLHISPNEKLVYFINVNDFETFIASVPFKELTSNIRQQNIRISDFQAAYLLDHFFSTSGLLSPIKMGITEDYLQIYKDNITVLLPYKKYSKGLPKKVRQFLDATPEFYGTSPLYLLKDLPCSHSLLEFKTKNGKLHIYHRDENLVITIPYKGEHFTPFVMIIRKPNYPLFAQASGEVEIGRWERFAVFRSKDKSKVTRIYFHRAELFYEKDIYGEVDLE